MLGYRCDPSDQWSLEGMASDLVVDALSIAWCFGMVEQQGLSSASFVRRRISRTMFTFIYTHFYSILVSYESNRCNTRIELYCDLFTCNH